MDKDIYEHTDTVSDTTVRSFEQGGYNPSCHTLKVGDNGKPINDDPYDAIAKCMMGFMN